MASLTRKKEGIKNETNFEDSEARAMKKVKIIFKYEELARKNFLSVLTRVLHLIEGRTESEGNARYRDNLAKVTQEIEAYTNRAFSYLLVSVCKYVS